jgi:hypothetical protein
VSFPRSTHDLSGIGHDLCLHTASEFYQGQQVSLCKLLMADCLKVAEFADAPDLGFKIFQALGAQPTISGDIAGFGLFLPDCP